MTFGVSRVTIRKAMDRLEREGRVLRQRGRGTFPQKPSAEADKAANQLLGELVSRSLARRVSRCWTMVSSGRPRHWRGLFDLAEGAELLRILRVRSDERSPISHTTCYLPADLAALVPRGSVSSLPVSATLASAGIPLERFEERITAVRVRRFRDVPASRCRDRDPARRDDPPGPRRGWPPDRAAAGALPARSYEYRVEYSIDDQNLGTHWKAMITDSGGA